MNLHINVAEGTATAHVTILDAPRDTPARELSLSDDVQAFVNESALVAVEASDTTRWGDPFDEDAAERLLAWARERLAGSAA